MMIRLNLVVFICSQSIRSVQDEVYLQETGLDQNNCAHAFTDQVYSAIRGSRFIYFTFINKLTFINFTTNLLLNVLLNYY